MRSERQQVSSSAWASKAKPWTHKADWDSWGSWKLGRTLADREPDSHQHDKFHYSKKSWVRLLPFCLQEGVELGASLLFIHTLIVDKSVALSHACQGTGYL